MLGLTQGIAEALTVHVQSPDEQKVGILSLDLLPEDCVMVKRLHHSRTCGENEIAHCIGLGDKIDVDAELA
jgi:hypothetical protein